MEFFNYVPIKTKWSPIRRLRSSRRVYLWLRERTGSLVFPISAHNSVNFVGQLI